MSWEDELSNFQGLGIQRRTLRGGKNGADTPPRPVNISSKSEQEKSAALESEETVSDSQAAGGKKSASWVT